MDRHSSTAGAVTKALSTRKPDSTPGVCQSVAVETDGTCTGPHPLTILASSREAAHSQVVSALRHKHGAVVLFCPLTHGGYVVSGRLVVERRETGELGTLTSSNKLISRLQRLRPMYDRVALILEETAAKEGRRAWCKPSRCLQSAVSRLHSSGVQVLFSQSPAHSASLLAALSSFEASQSHGISLTQAAIEAVPAASLQLVMKVPGMAYIAALLILTSFRTLGELLHSPPEVLRARVPSLTTRRSREICNFFTHSFNPHLVP